MNEYSYRRKVVKSEFAKQWYDYGCSADDEIARFMYLWITFNWIYGDRKYFKHRTDFFRRHPGLPSEREQILNCVDDYFESLIEFDAFSIDEFEYFRKREVRDARTDRLNMFDGKRTDNEYLNSEDARDQVRGMFLTLYQIRCNLFHGSKSTRGDDRNLIRIGAAILEGYLEQIVI